MTITQFAHAMEVRDRTVERWEAGQRQIALSQLQRAAEVLACPWADLLGNGDDEPSRAVA